MSGRWSLLTNHALVVLHVVQYQRSTLSDIADSVGITDRAALAILRTLEADKIIARKKDGRRIEYTVDLEALINYRAYGTYTITQIAMALLAASGRDPMGELPPGLQPPLGSVANRPPLTSEESAPA